MRGKSLLLMTLSLLLVLALGGGIGGLWEEARAEEPAPPATRLLASPVGTAFTYQGRLIKDGNPVNKTCDFTFGLYDVETGGTPIDGALLSSVGVSNGLFTVQLDFGADAFTGEARWLGIAVKCSGDADFTTLTPRQPLTPTPYALYARSIPLAGSGSATTAARSDHNHFGAIWSDGGVGLTLMGGTVGILGEGSDYGVWGASTSGAAIYAQGKIQSQAKSHVFVPGNQAQGHGVVPASLTLVRWDTSLDVSSTLLGTQEIVFPVILPSVLYGQPVSIDGLRVYLNTEGATAADNRVQRVAVLSVGTDGISKILYNWTGTMQGDTWVWADYDFLPKQLSADEGFLSVYIELDFNNTSKAIHIGGVRLTLRHY